MSSPVDRRFRHVMAEVPVLRATQDDYDEDGADDSNAQQKRLSCDDPRMDEDCAAKSTSPANPASLIGFFGA